MSTSLLHIFRAGTYTAMSGQAVALSAADLAACARAYDPARHEAPLVVGHPLDNHPAYGWVAGLTANGEDLEAVPRDLNADFAAAVRERRYSKVSASFWPPTHPENPVPGVWSLRHVGFLGAAVPAVLGLRPVALASADAELITLEFAAPEAESTPATEQPMPDQAPETADFAAREAALNARETALKQQADALAAREQAIKTAEAEARRAEVVEFAARVVTAHGLAPSIEPRIVAVLADPAADIVSFAATDAEGAREVPRETALRELVEALSDPKNRVPLGEFAGSNKGFATSEARDEAETEAAARRMLGLPPQTQTGAKP